MRTINVIFLVIMFLVFLTGVFYFLTSLFPHPTKATKKNIKAFKNRDKINEKKDETESALTETLQNWSKKIAKFINLNPIERSETEKSLQIVGDSSTPEEFYALCILQGSLFGVAGLFVAIVGLIAKTKLIIFVGVGVACLGVVLFFLKKKSIVNEKKDIVDAIEAELPRFVAYIRLALKTNNGSILSLIERYTPHSETFKNELNQTMADAKSSSFTAGMTRWNNRINSDKLKQVVNGLISANNGDDVVSYFDMLDKDFTAFQKTLLHQQVKTISKRMGLPKLLMTAMIFLTMFFPIVMQVITSFKEVFN